MSAAGEIVHTRGRSAILRVGPRRAVKARFFVSYGAQRHQAYRPARTLRPGAPGPG